MAELRPFKFWVQNVLPIVYDDSLSYYELLNKVVNYLNGTIGDVNQLTVAFNELKKYVDNYFDSANFDELLDQKLDELVTSGEFTEILETAIGQITTEVEQAITELNSRLEELQDKIDIIDNVQQLGRGTAYPIVPENVDTYENYYNGNLGSEIEDSFYASFMDTKKLSHVASKQDVDNKLYYKSSLSQSTFRFALRMPSYCPFSVEQFLSELEVEKRVMLANNWEYITQAKVTAGGDTVTTFMQIPLYTRTGTGTDYTATANNLTAGGVGIKGTSCAMAICNVLYRLGYQNEFGGDAKYTEARVKEVSMPYTLMLLGWDRIDDQNELQPGDIVFVGGSRYANQRRYNPEHEFVYASSGSTGEMAFDFGSTNLIRNWTAANNGKNVINWGDSALRNQLASAWTNGRFLVRANSNNPYAAGTALWHCEVFIDGQQKFCVCHNLDNGITLKVSVSGDDSNGSGTLPAPTLTKIRKLGVQQHLLLGDSVESGVNLDCDIDASGNGILKFHGVLNQTMNAGTYEIGNLADMFPSDTALRYTGSIFASSVTNRGTPFRLLCDNTTNPGSSLFTVQTFGQAVSGEVFALTVPIAFA